MKIKLDENIPAGLKETLAGFGHVVDTVPEEGWRGRNDADVWAATQDAGAFLITQDLDSSDVHEFQPGTHHGILLLRLHEPGRASLLRRMRAICESEDMEDWRGCFVVVTERKIRVRRPTT